MPHLFAIACLALATAAFVQTAPTTKPGWLAGNPTAPADLPGKGLAQHDFFYAGEAKTRDMYVVRAGKIAWAYHDDAGRGEISDATLLPDGNVLFAHQFGVTLIDATRRVLWHVDAAEHCEIHTAQMIGSDRVIYIVNGPQPKVVVANIKTGANEKELPLPVKNVDSTHGQFRHARLTPAGTLLVAHMDMGNVAEYDETGKEVWSCQAPGCWAADRLANGNTLVTCNQIVREVNAAGETVWQLTPDDLPGYRVTQFQIATRLPNGNTLVNNWVNQWDGPIGPATAPAQAWEVTPDKNVVWALREWSGDAALGPATTIQLLDDRATSPTARFGSIK